MQLNTRTGDVSGNVSNDNKKRFTFKNNPKIFKILSDGLYSDKVSSIIRELACNAYDAHVAAGNVDTPFEVWTPYGLDGTFMIKDFGIGLSPEDVEKVFSCYGESTKSSSNEFVGAFGLGSKTPFAYTESYTVTSRFDGVETIYTCYIDEEGYPSIMKMASGTTTESNGLAVSFPVNERDYSEFQRKAQDVLKYFETPVNLDGREAERYATDEIWVQGERFKFFDNRRMGLKAFVGNVPYDIDFYRLGDEDLSYEVRSHLRGNVGGFIYFDIGELEVSVSRESIGYSEATKATIKKRLNEVYKDYIAKIVEKYDTIKSPWEKALKMRADFGQSYGRMPEGLLDEVKISIDMTKFEACNVLLIKTEANGYSGRSRRKRFDLTNPTDASLLNRYNYQVTGIKYNEDTDKLDITPNNSMVIMSASEKLPVTKLQSYLGANHNGKVFLVVVPKNNITDKELKKVKAEVKRFKKSCGQPPSDKIMTIAKSDLPKNNTAARTYYSNDNFKGVVTLEKVDKGSYYNSRIGYSWKPSIEDEESFEKLIKELKALKKSERKALYYIINGHQIVTKEGKQVSVNEELMKRLHSVCPGIKVYGVRKNHLDKIKKTGFMDLLIPVADYATKALEKNVKKYSKLEVQHSNRKNVRNHDFYYDTPGSVIWQDDFIEELAKHDENFGTIHETANSGPSNSEKLSEFVYLAKHFGVELEDEDVDEFDEMMNEMSEKYPLLLHMQGYIYSEKMPAVKKAVLDYVKLINNSK